MLVRISTILLLRNPFPSSLPITLVQTPSLSNSLADEQIISPNTTARSVNTVHSNYDTVTDIATTTIPSTLLLQQDLYHPASLIDRSCTENDINKSEEPIKQDYVNLKTADTFCASQIHIQRVQEEAPMQQKVEEQVKKPLQVETEIVQVQHLVQVEESDQTKESLQVEESVQVEEPVQVKEIESEQVKEPEQAMKIEQVNEPEPVIEIEQMPEHVTQQANESEQETIVLDIAQRRPSYVPEITLADITEELDISKCETLEIPEKTQREAARSILLEKSINSVIPRTQSATISTHESVDDESVVYYKRHEDFHPKIETLTPSASTNTAQRKRYSLYAALGTRVHPRSSLDDSKGMPVFQPPAPATVADKLKPKTMLKRFKTIVRNKKKSTTL